ncbi:MAG: NFACT family protein [Planctomycetota bacterium]
MSMMMNELEQIVEEAAPRLKGRSVLSFRDAGPDTFMLIMEEVEGGHPKLLRLLISVRPEMDRVHLTSQRSPKKSQVAQTRLSPRVHDLLENTRLDSLEILNHDRVLKFSFNDRANKRKLLMIVELIGRHANLLIIDQQGVIVDQFREFHGRHRCLIHGAKYVSPPPPKQKSGKKTPPRFEVGIEPPWPEAPLNGVADLYFRKEEFEWEKARLSARLLERVSQALQRQEGMRNRLYQELQATEGAERFKTRGDLLQAHFRLLKRGMSSVEVQDLFDAPGKTIVIPLDAAKDPSENIKALYKRYKKLKNSVEHLTRRIKKTDDAIQSLRLLQAMIPVAEGPDELYRIAEEHGLLPTEKTSMRGKKPLRNDLEAGIRRFYSSDHLTILVGKDGKSNERLTFQVARGNDMWLHCQDAAGSHIVVRKDQAKPVPLDSLIDAGLLAMHFSKRRNSDKAEVIYTERKHLKKIKGAQPGRVRVERFRSLNIIRNPDRLKKILANAENPQIRPCKEPQDEPGP